MINGDGKAPPPTESEYEKIEIFSNSVPIEAYLKLKQMLVESDNRIHELLAANQDLKQEVSLLQSMVQTLMEENIHLRKGGGGGISNGDHYTNGNNTADTDTGYGGSLNPLATAFFQTPASTASWTPEMQRRMAAFHRALMRETGVPAPSYASSASNATASTLDFYRPATPTSADQLVNFNVNNDNELSSSTIPPLSPSKMPAFLSAFPSNEDQLNMENNNNVRNRLSSIIEDKNSHPSADSPLQQRINRTSSDLDRIAFAASQLQPQHLQQQPQRHSRRLSAGATRDDSSIPASSRGGKGGVGNGETGRSQQRNRPVSMFEPRLAMSSRDEASGNVNSTSQSKGAEVFRQPHPNQMTTMLESDSMHVPPPLHSGWINSYSARGEGPAGNVHQVIVSIFLSVYLPIFLYPFIYLFFVYLFICLSVSNC